MTLIPTSPRKTKETIREHLSLLAPIWHLCPYPLPLFLLTGICICALGQPLYSCARAHSSHSPKDMTNNSPSSLPRWYFYSLLNHSFSFLFFLGPHLRHMEVPRPGIESQLQLLAYTNSHNNMGSEPCLVTYTTAHGNAESLTH